MQLWRFLHLQRMSHGSMCDVPHQSSAHFRWTLSQKAGGRWGDFSAGGVAVGPALTGRRLCRRASSRLQQRVLERAGQAQASPEHQLGRP